MCYGIDSGSCSVDGQRNPPLNWVTSATTVVVAHDSVGPHGNPFTVLTVPGGPANICVDKTAVYCAAVRGDRAGDIDVAVLRRRRIELLYAHRRNSSFSDA